MNKRFNKICIELPRLLSELLNHPLTPWGEFRSLPNGGGIYVLYENSKPIYTGRTRNFLMRLRQHGNRSSGHFSAPFAFNLARKEFYEQNILKSEIKLKRNSLEKDKKFIEFFNKAKERVRNMKYRVIKIDDPVYQHIFELYVAIALGTEKYNGFDTH